MSIFDEEQTLPGVFTEVISDYNIGYDTSLFGTTDSVLVIGTAFNGPVGKIVKVYSPEYGTYIFGKAYNTTTRKEATLVSAIQDAWDRGCRTIYAIRVSGKEIYKDYQLISDTNMKLRVSGLYPSNENKDLYFVYDNDDYSRSITFYKPADRATIKEKKKGAVNSATSVVVNHIDLYGIGLTANNDLTELISAFNNYTYNNVLKLSIVDEDGNDVTATPEAKALRIGDMFPGLYTIGRQANAEGVIADTDLDVSFTEKPYENFEGVFSKVLKYNTNVSRNLPLYSKDGNLNELIGISSVDQYEFLEVLNKIDNYFIKDSIDYEETDLTDFELYKKLGSGFAINAGITVTEVTLADGSKKIKTKVREITDKATKKSGIKDGIYSMIENATVNYRVLAGAYADTTINGKLPKANDFKAASPKALKLLNDSVELTADVDKSDLTEPKKYNVTFEFLDESASAQLDTDLEELKNYLYSDVVARQATIIAYNNIVDNKASYKEGSLFLVTDVPVTDADVSSANLLYVYHNDEFVNLHNYLTVEDIDLLKGSLIFADGKIYSASVKVTNSTNTNLFYYSFAETTPAILGTNANGDANKYLIVALDEGIFLIAKYETGSTTTVHTLNDFDPTASYLTDSVVVSDEKPYVAITDTVAGDLITDALKFAEITAFNSMTDYSLATGVDKYVLEDNKVYKATSSTGTLTAFDATAFEYLGTVKDVTVTGTSCTILGTVEQCLSENEDKILTAISSSYNENNIIIRSNAFDFLTVDEVVEFLQEDNNFKQLFNIKVVNLTKSQDTIEEMKENGYQNTFVGSFDDKAIVYNESLLIPYRTDDNFARQLAQHCAYTTIKTGSTHGIIGVKPIINTSLESITSRVKELIDLDLMSGMIAKKDNGTNILNKDNLPYHIGHYVSVVAAQYNFVDDNNFTVLSNGAAGYAGMVSCLALDQSSTCQSIVIPDLTYELSNYQLTQLTSSGYVTIKKSYTKGWVVTDGITMGDVDSSQKRLSATRISNAIAELLREAGEPYIGKQNHIANQNALRAAIKSQLDTIKGTLIEGYEFKLITGTDQDMGVITIEYAIIPIYEIKQIFNNVTITE